MLDMWFFDLQKRKEKGIFKGINKGYDIPPNCKIRDVFNHLVEEVEELKVAFEKNNLDNVLNEIADLSNLCDFFYETMFQLKR